MFFGALVAVAAGAAALMLYPGAPSETPPAVPSLQGLGSPNPFGKAFGDGPPPAQAQAEGDGRRAARLRWSGPAQVRVGETFTVAVKATFPQPLRAAPMQLSFDPSVLELVEVRAGAFFAGGKFSYRISPTGSIYFGAAGGEAVVAADAELLIASFRPLQAGVTAELKLSSRLEDAAGRAIASEGLSPFQARVVD